MNTRKLFALACGYATTVALALGPLTAHAQNYPSQPIHLIVASTPGGGTDVLARAIAQKLTPVLGASVVAENYPGANGNIGAQRAARSPANGYTIMMVSAPHAVNTSIYRNLAYDPIKDFSPIVSVASVPMVLTVPASSPIKSVADLIAQAKAQPGQLTYSSGGIGSQEHISGLMLGQIAGVQLEHIPYKGSGQSVTDLLAGRISLAFNTMPSVLQHIKSGALRPLAVGSAKRSPMLPDVPTMKEAGVAGFESEQWYGLVAPTGTSKEIIARLNNETDKILQTEEIRQLFLQMGALPTGGSPAQFGAFFNSEVAKYAKLAKALNLSAEQ